MKDYNLRFEIINALENTQLSLWDRILYIWPVDLPVPGAYSIQTGKPLTRLQRLRLKRKYRNLRIDTYSDPKDIFEMYEKHFDLVEIGQEEFSFRLREHSFDDDRDIVVCEKGEGTDGARLYHVVPGKIKEQFYSYSFTSFLSYDSIHTRREFQKTMPSTKAEFISPLYLYFDGKNIVSNNDSLNDEIVLLEGITKEDVKDRNRRYIKYLKTLDSYLKAYSTFQFEREYTEYFRRKNSDVR